VSTARQINENALTLSVEECTKALGISKGLEAMLDAAGIDFRRDNVHHGDRVDQDGENVHVDRAARGQE
jgi:hypothetical protein